MLFTAMIIVIGLTAAAAVAIVGSREGSFAGQTFSAPVHASSPLDEADRILARRYAKGEITPEEYDRMLIILRR